MFTKIIINSIGKTQAEFAQAESHYCKLIKTKLSLVTHNTLSNLSSSEQIAKESHILFEKIGKVGSKGEGGRDFIISLDPRGNQLSSEEFAAKLSHISESQAGECKSLHFVIGGSHGLSDAARAKSNMLLSLSKFTMPHQLAKIMLLEQIYRAETIISGKHYHK